MKIRTKIQLNTIVSLGIIIGISLSLFFTYRQVQHANIKSAIAFKIVNGMFELNMLTHDYLLHHTGRAQIQWQNRHESIARLLVSKVFKDTEEVSIVKKILSQHGSLRVNFKKLVQNQRKRKQLAENTVLLDELDDRLIGQLSVKSQSIVSDSHKLEAITHSKFTAIQQSATLFIVVSITVLALLIGSFVFITIRNVIRPMAKLQLGAEIIGKGNLTHKIDIKSRDEVGDLARAFNDMAEKLEESYSSLETKITQRTEELDRSNKELDDFAYTASHDLKEPLRGIHNYSTFLIEDYGEKLDDEGKRKLNTLTKLSQHLEDLINNLLYYSRVGRTQESYKETSLNNIVEEVIDTLSIRIKEESIDIRMPSPLPTVHCDKVRIKDVFSNLISNAIKYNDKEEKWIEIGAVKDKTKDAHMFYVRDNGIGIREKHFDSAFKMFKQLHGREKYGGGGTGAGLAIVKKIIENHGGKVWIESTFGQGTTFYFTLGSV